MNDFWKNIKPLPTAQDNNIDNFVSSFELNRLRAAGYLPQRSPLSHLTFGMEDNRQPTPKELNSRITGTSKYKGKTIPEYSGSWDDAYNKARQDFGIHGSKVIMWNGKPMNIESASQKGEWASTTDDPNSYPYLEDLEGEGLSREETAAMNPEYLNRIKKYRAASPEVQAEMEEEERYYSSLVAAQEKAQAAQEGAKGRKPWKFNYNNEPNFSPINISPEHVVGLESDDVEREVWSDISGHDPSLYHPDSANVNYDYNFNTPGEAINKLTGRVIEHKPFEDDNTYNIRDLTLQDFDDFEDPIGEGYTYRNSTPPRSGKTLEGDFIRSEDQTKGRSVHDMMGLNKNSIFGTHNGRYSIPGEYYNTMKETLSPEDFKRWYQGQIDDAAIPVAKGLAKSIGQGAALNKEATHYAGLRDKQRKDDAWDKYENGSWEEKAAMRGNYFLRQPFHSTYATFANPIINEFVPRHKRVSTGDMIKDEIYGTNKSTQGSAWRPGNQFLGRDNWADFLVGSIPYHMANSAIELPGGLKDIVTGDDVSGGYEKVGMAALNWVPFMQPLKKAKQLGQFATNAVTKAPSFLKNSAYHAGDLSMGVPSGTTQNFATGALEYGTQMANKAGAKLGVSKHKTPDWGAWNASIPTNNALMKEYGHIENITKKRGTWMKNTDGSAFKGTPEQFVQIKSKNFNLAYPEGYHTAFRGQKKPMISPTKYAEKYIEKYGSPVRDIFMGSKNQALTYTGKGQKHSGKIWNPQVNTGEAGALQELIYPKSTNSVTLDAAGSYWNKLEFPSILENLNTARGYKKMGHNYTGGKVPHNWQSKFIDTNDIAEWGLRNKKNYTQIDNLIDYGSERRIGLRGIFDPRHTPTKTHIVNSNAGIKSFWHNDGGFNLKIDDVYKAEGGEYLYPSYDLPQAQLWNSVVRGAKSLADDAYKYTVKKPLNKAKDYWNKPMPLDPVTLTQSVPKGYATAVGEYPGMTQGKYFLHTLNTPTRLAYQSKPVQSLLKSKFAETVKKPFTGFGTEFKKLGQNLKSFEASPVKPEYIIPEIATGREARIAKTIRGFGTGIKENEQVLTHGYGKGEREAYEFLQGVEKQADLLTDYQFETMFKFPKTELAGKVQELAARTSHKKAGSVGDQMSEMAYRDLSTIVNDAEAAAIVARTPEEQGLIHAQWNDDITRMANEGATPGELSRARRQEQQLTDFWRRNNIDLSRNLTPVESVDEILAGLESLTPAQRTTRIAELSNTHPEFQTIHRNSKTIDQIIHEHYTTVGGRRMRNNRFPDAAAANESLRSQGITEEMVNTIGLETTNPAYIRARIHGPQGATSPSGTNASSTSAVLQGNGTQEQVLDYIIDNGVVGNGQFGIRGNPAALQDLISNYGLNLSAISNHYTARGRFMPPEVSAAINNTSSAISSGNLVRNTASRNAAKEAIKKEGLFVSPLKSVNSFLERRSNNEIFQVASPSNDTKQLLGTAFAGDGKNIATLYKQAFRKVMDSPKGSRFTGSGSLSDDSWHGTNALAKLAHMKGDVDIVFSGHMPSNNMNFSSLVATPEFRLRNINRLVKEINLNLPDGEKIPFAYVDGNTLQMPRIDVIRKAFGGETVSGPYTMDTYDLSDENIFTPYDKELMDINEMDIEDALGVYKKYMNGGYVGTINEQVAEKVYNLANQKAYVSAKQKGMSPANYIMTNIIG